MQVYQSVLKGFMFVAATLMLHSIASAEGVDAKWLLKQRLQQLNTFQANFSQQVTDAQQNQLQQATGSIVLQYPNKLYWRMDAPNDNILVADGRTLWQLDPFMEQVVALDQAQAVNNNPLILLTNPNGDEWQSFKVEEVNNRFEITPLDGHAEVAKLSLSFKDAELVAMEIIDSQQQVSALSFSQIKQNAKVEQSLFEFVIPEGYELDDQRAP